MLEIDEAAARGEIPAPVFTALTPAPAVSLYDRVQEWWQRATALFTPVGRVVWHPGFAYLLLVVLVPAVALRSTLTPDELPSTPTVASREPPMAELAFLHSETGLLLRGGMPETPGPARLVFGPLADKPTVVPLKRGEFVALTVPEVVLRVPVAVSARAEHIDVRVRDDDRRRELRERHPGMTDEVDVHLPAAWLLPGTYRLELLLPGEPSAPSQVFHFEARVPTSAPRNSEPRPTPSPRG
jgi:hypothetical protein